MLVNNRAIDRRESNRHRNKNWMFLEHNFSWPLACTNIILKIDNSQSDSITLVVCEG